MSARSGGVVASIRSAHAERSGAIVFRTASAGDSTSTRLEPDDGVASPSASAFTRLSLRPRSSMSNTIVSSRGENSDTFW